MPKPSIKNAYLPDTSITVRVGATELGKLIAELSLAKLAEAMASMQAELIFRTAEHRKAADALMRSALGEVTLKSPETQASQLIFMNGPPRSGKDYGAEGCVVYKFATEVKDGTHKFYGLGDIPTEYYEEVKDIPHAVFNGKTPREAYIWYSEECIKPKHGRGYFGVLLGRRMRHEAHLHSGKKVFVTDTGFKGEMLSAYPYLHDYAQDTVMVRVHKKGCDFSNDSRSHLYLSLQSIREVDVTNDGTDSYLELLRRV